MDYSQFFKWEMDTKSFTIVRILKTREIPEIRIKNEAITFDQKIGCRKLNEKHRNEISLSLLKREVGHREERPNEIY